MDLYGCGRLVSQADEVSNVCMKLVHFLKRECDYSIYYVLRSYGKSRKTPSKFI